jgi:hypothetical protein
LQRHKSCSRSRTTNNSNTFSSATIQLEESIGSTTYYSAGQGLAATVPLTWSIAQQHSVRARVLRSCTTSGARAHRGGEDEKGRADPSLFGRITPMATSGGKPIIDESTTDEVHQILARVDKLLASIRLDAVGAGPRVV